ncbi:uncharacterized protein LOC125847380 [Solanum stenotomum]|uniref:uncharacterized protein LOC125847378 n=1 Tax=Solanum stenotomum TaxID=172797 RepID=UPI0020D0F301|nr:uncharacterized protein LOC125847378 [Solanum stenotomum]XP_049382969.1 uncharacterized protein LOC125847380 [Solanum stenotomum]
MAEKEGAIVKKGHEEGFKMMISLLEEFKLPLGIFPVVDVIEVGFVKNTGYMWIQQAKKVEHKFKMLPKPASYDTEISGYIDKNRIKKLKGLKVNTPIVSHPVNEIIVDDPPTGNIQFKGFAGISRTIPLEYFVAGQ